MTQFRAVLALVIAMLVISDCSRQPRVFAPAAPHRNGHCQAADGLPDPVCTPGVADFRVTQNVIHSTICVSGYTATVRPRVSYTNALKRRQLAEYGYADTDTHDYEEDHLIPLELGGDPVDPRNLWPEPARSPNRKDAVERRLHRLVCTGRMSLEEAQRRIRTNWKTALE